MGLGAFGLAAGVFWLGPELELERQYNPPPAAQTTATAAPAADATDDIRRQGKFLVVKVCRPALSVTRGGSLPRGVKLTRSC